MNSEEMFDKVLEKLVNTAFVNGMDEAKINKLDSESSYFEGNLHVLEDEKKQIEDANNALKLRISKAKEYLIANNVNKLSKSMLIDCVVGILGGGLE